MNAVRIGVAIGVAGAALALARTARSNPPLARPALVATGLTAASLPLVRDPLVLWALVARFGAAALHDRVARRLYRRSRLDSEKYHRLGRMLARELRAGNLRPARARPGIAGMTALTALVHLLVGSSRLAAAFVFAWLGFVGLVLFHRAFVLAVPGGDAREYLLLLCCLPTLLVFPSRISKQAWMLLALGLASLGVAMVAQGDAAGLALLALGIALATLVRPHVAALVAVSALVAIGKRRGLAACGAVGVVVALGARHLSRWGIDPSKGLVGALRTAGAKSNYGGSAFTPVLPTSLGRLPLSLATVLFRPHVLEARTRTRPVALESAFVLVLSLVRLRSFLAAAREPYGRFALVFTGLFGLAYSGVGNFGLLADHRSQVLPFYLVPLAFRPGSGPA